MILERQTHISFIVKAILILSMAIPIHMAFAGSATLTWDAPTTNADGSPLTDLEGYIVYYGTSSGVYTNSIDVGNVTTYQVNNLTNGATYYFAVTAYDTSGNESNYSNEVSKTISSPNTPPSADAGGPYTGIEGQTISLNASASSDADGTIVLYEWDIDNDGTYDYSSSSSVQSHTYTQQGTYTVKLRVTDDLGATDVVTTTVTVSDTSPTADFSASPANGTAPLTVTFTNNSSGYDQPLSYEWDFDYDGTTDSTLQNPSYTYTKGGTYTVKLKVTDADGSANILIKTGYINVTSLYSLTVNINGNGTVSSSPEGINCGSDCTESYASGSTVTLTATPQTGYQFDGWTGCSNSKGNQCIITLSSDTTVTASFTLKTYTITATAGSGGTISPSGNVTVNWGDTQVFTITPNTGYQIVDVKVDGVSQGTLTTYTFTNLSANHTIEVLFVSGNYSLSCTDGGNIECIERTDGGDDSNNIYNGKPRVSNMDFRFKLTVIDTTGSQPQYVRLFIAQRSNPSASDFYGYDMSCGGSYSTGAVCSYITKLGPSASHSFYFEVKMADGTLIRYPSSGYITGPGVNLLTGYNMVGLPGDTGTAALDGSSAFGSSLTYRWDPHLGYYTLVTSNDPIRTGEGYFTYKVSNTLPPLTAYSELTDTEFTYEIKPGWNIISNPYSGNVRLSDIKVKRGNDAPVSWDEAVSNGWLTNAIYYNTGRDWGDTYTFETTPDATLVPWMAYWIQLNMSDETYYLVIPRPSITSTDSGGVQ